jgi:hypothetical protein
LVDLDGDGILDIVSGSWPGELYFFKGLGKGQYQKGEKLKDRDGKEIKLGSASTVFAVDWSGKGVLDLLVGDIEGKVWLVPNEGTAKKPDFGSPRQLNADGKAITVPHGDSHPIAADWDGDGLLDLIVGAGDGSVLWYRNVGTPKEPKLAAARVLVAASTFGQKHPPEDSARDQVCMRAKVCVVDWNGDGRLDLLVGDAGYTQPPPPKLTREEEEARKRAQDEYNKLTKEYQPLLQEQSKLFQVPQNEKSEAKAEREKKQREVQEKLKPFYEKSQPLIEAITKGQGRSEWHGHVWLFLRKPAKEAESRP